MRDTQSEILNFWFNQTKPAQWFQVNTDFDALIKDQFESAYHLARQGIFDNWKTTPDGCLALIILLDQFPRNMYRGQAQAFETDSQALEIARYVLEKSFDKVMTINQKRFAYLPFEHDETMESQEKAVQLFETIRHDDPLGYDYALRHKEVIEKFGRFPGRNIALSRESTQEERDYLATNPGF